MGPLGIPAQAFMADEPTEGLGGSAQMALDVSAETNPLASMVGSVGGLVGGPAGKALTMLGGATTRGFGITSNLAGRGAATKVAAHFLNNLVAGVTTNTAARLVEARKDDATIGTRLADAIGDFSSPTGAALFGGSAILGAAVSARLQRGMDADLRPIIAKFERITGKRVPADTLTNAREMQGFMDMVARTPGMADEVAKVEKSMKQGVLQMIDHIRKSQGAKGGRPESVAERAAVGARKLTGTGFERESGTLTKLRRSTEQAAIGPAKRAVLPDPMLRSMQNGFRHLKNTRGLVAKAGAIDEIGDSFADLVNKSQQGGKPLRFEDFEAIRKEIGKIAFPANALEAADPRISTRARYEASRFMKLMLAARQRYFPAVDSAMEVAEKLRRAEDALPMERIQQLDDVTMRRFLGGAGAPKRIASLLQYGSPDDVAAARGWLFNEAMQSITKQSGEALSTTDKVSKAFRASGPMNRQVVDALMPGFRREMTDLAKLGDVMFGRGLLGPAGSQTYGRGARAITAVAVPASIAAATYAMLFLEDPYSKVAATLGPLGVATAVGLLSKSAVSGSLQHLMGDLARGQARPPVRTPVALRQAGPAFSGLMGGGQMPPEQ
jgi:hypothetical protein